jgi:hypothetical protein
MSPGKRLPLATDARIPQAPQKSVNASRKETMRLPICGTLHLAL